MKVLTLHRPWAYAIAFLGKDIENRSWNCYLWQGTLFGIHAGKKWDSDGAAWIESEFGLVLPEAAKQEGIVAVTTFDGNVTESNSPWFIEDSIGWKLKDIKPLSRAIECKGSQGLWSTTEPQLNEIFKQLGL